MKNEIIEQIFTWLLNAFCCLFVYLLISIAFCVFSQFYSLPRRENDFKISDGGTKHFGIIAKRSNKSDKHHNNILIKTLARESQISNHQREEINSPVLSNTKNIFRHSSFFCAPNLSRFLCREKHIFMSNFHCKQHEALLVLLV